MRFFLVRLAVVAALPMCLAPAASAESWVGALSGTQTWTMGDNWDPNAAPNGIDAAAIFPTGPTGTLTVQITAPVIVGSISAKNDSSPVLNISSSLPANTLTFDTSGADATFVSPGISTSNNNIIVSAAVILNKTLHFTIDTAGSGPSTNAITGTMTGVGGFTKDGPGGLTFANNTKTYAGPTVINDGRFRLENAGRPTGTSSITVNNGGQLYLSDNNINWALGAAGMCSITINGPGDGTGMGATPGAITSRSGTNTLANPVILGSDATIDVFGSSLRLNGGLTGTGNLTKTGVGTLIVPTANSYVGNTLVNAGRVELQNATSLSTGSATVASGAELVFSGATTNFTVNNPMSIAGVGAGDLGAIVSLAGAAPTIAGPVTLTGNSQLTVSGPSSITYSNANAFTGTNVNLMLQGAASTGSGMGGTISGAISLGTGSLTKSEAGTWRLNSPTGNSYSGGTSLATTGGAAAGKLIVNNTSGSGTGSGPVSITNATLGGSGIITGAVTANIAAHISPGETGAGLLTVGNVTFQGNSWLDIELGGAGVSPPIQFDRLAATGTATINGGTLKVTLLPNYLPATNDTFHILTTTGGFTTSTHFMTMLPTLPFGQWEVNYATNYLELKVVSNGVAPGDWNGDGHVDAADYVVWRKDTVGHGGAAGYNVWRANFGNPPGSGAGSLVSGAEVPEPTCLAFLALGFATLVRRREVPAMGGVKAWGLKPISKPWASAQWLIESAGTR